MQTVSSGRLQSKIMLYFEAVASRLSKVPEQTPGGVSDLAVLINERLPKLKRDDSSLSPVFTVSTPQTAEHPGRTP